MKQGFVFVISGPSGVGKGTIIKSLLKRRDDLYLTISATTRIPRKEETDKVDYHFLSEDQFEKDIKQNKFVEWCEVHKYKYGTYFSEVDNYLKLGKNVVLEIDTQGAQKVRSKLENVISFFILPPNNEVLIKRLEKRNTEKESAVKLRLTKVESELVDLKYYDYAIVNDVLEDAVEDILTIINNLI